MKNEEKKILSRAMTILARRSSENQKKKFGKGYSAEMKRRKLLGLQRQKQKKDGLGNG